LPRSRRRRSRSRRWSASAPCSRSNARATARRRLCASAGGTRSVRVPVQWRSKARWALATTFLSHPTLLSLADGAQRLFSRWDHSGQNGVSLFSLSPREFSICGPSKHATATTAATRVRRPVLQGDRTGASRQCSRGQISENVTTCSCPPPPPPLCRDLAGMVSKPDRYEGSNSLSVQDGPMLLAFSPMEDRIRSCSGHDRRYRLAQLNQI